MKFRLRSGSELAEVFADHANLKEKYTVETYNILGETIVEYLKNGYLHRIGGPAYMEICSASGVVTDETWAQEGAFHRVDGPAMVKRDADTGKVMLALWWNKGEAVSHPEAIVEGRLASVVRAEAARQAPQARGPR